MFYLLVLNSVSDQKSYTSTPSYSLLIISSKSVISSDVKFFLPFQMCFRNCHYIRVFISQEFHHLISFCYYAVNIYMYYFQLFLLCFNCNLFSNSEVVIQQHLSLFFSFFILLAILWRVLLFLIHTPYSSVNTSNLIICFRGTISMDSLLSYEREK